MSLKAASANQTASEFPKPIDAGQSFFQDPYPFLAEVREFAPAWPVRFPDGIADERWLICRHHDVVAALADPRLSNDLGTTMDPPDGDRSKLPLARQVILRANDLLGEAVAHLDPPEHSRVRRLASRPFRADRIERFRPRIADLAAQAVARLPEGEFDLMEAVARPLPISIVCEVLGVPVADAEVFRDVARVIGGFVEDGASAETLRVLDDFDDYVRRLIAGKRNHPGDDVLSALTSVQHGGDQLSEDELVSLSALLILAGHETTVQLIAGGLLALFAHPDQFAQVRADLSLLPGVVEETLRYDGSVNPGVPRLATEDIPLGDQVIPAESYVVIGIAAANRDPRKWDRPDEFDINRKQAGRLLSFGHGIHYCLGAKLSRIVGEETLRALLTRFPEIELAAPRDQLRWRNGFIRVLEKLPLRSRANA
uniref:EpxC n=1 Tax=Goodfellowiella coeruleoviolacea TaxID=334858 RepID=V5RQ25_9PSEU|nr:EpxC [Goodfellowiella coeruleoviolacea]